MDVVKIERPVRRQCNLCEAGCGLLLTVADGQIASVGPDIDDPVSCGYVCPKGLAIADIQDDPDRLRHPVRRNPDGSFREVTWEEALDTVASGLKRTKTAHGADAIAVYFGNPLVHSYSAMLMVSALLDTLGTRNRTSASSQDVAPRFAVSHYLYGNTMVFPVPDIDRTEFLLCMGANPVVSQGSAMVTPNVRARIRAIRERGGKVVTVDPRRTETARIADEHIFIRPGGDAALLLAMTRVLVEAGAVDRARIEQIASGWADVERALEVFTPERVEACTRIDAKTIRRLALEFAQARSSVIYTRVGTCNTLHGTLATYANDLLNIAAGRLGAEGGAMFPEPALDAARIAALSGMNGHARWRSRVRGLPETASLLPAAVLAEEMETPGAGQVRALLTIAGNPVLSTPNGTRLDRAIAQLEFVAAIDLYITETTRHADVILPPCWTLSEDHMDPLAESLSLRSHLRWSPPVLARGEGELADWEILLRLAERLGGGPTAVPCVDRALGLAGRLGWHFQPSLAADFLVRTGRHGDHFLPWSDGLSLKKVRASAHGVDKGRARPGISHRIFHRDQKVHLAAAPLLEAMGKLGGELAPMAPPDQLLLIGRRHVRSNNSWMHNLPSLVSGRERCVLLVHPVDAMRLGIRDGQFARMESAVYEGAVPIRVSDEIMPGVVSLPHGWGHGASATWQQVAARRPGVSVNDWTDDQCVEEVVGESVLNGVPIALRPIAPGSNTCGTADTDGVASDV
jgi:anaerobic selenocysteine-containing dehydrogenase